MAWGRRGLHDGRMIRVAIVDDHPAVRMGVYAALRSEPGLVPVGAAQMVEEVDPLLYRTRPDVVLLDYCLPRRDGLSLCREVKSGLCAPAVLIYSAYAGASMVVPAIVAGADGIVHKGSPTRLLFEAIRIVGRGGSVLPAVSADLLQVAGATLDAEDVPILDMLVARTPPGDIADSLGLSPIALRERVEAMLQRLRSPVATSLTSPP